MDAVRCRHCHAFALPDAARCPVCHGTDPGGRRHALLGSVFLGGLTAAGVVAAFAAGVWWKWHRWQALFGEPEDPTALDNARRTALLVDGLLFVIGSFASASAVHRLFRSR